MCGHHIDLIDERIKRWTQRLSSLWLIMTFWKKYEPKLARFPVVYGNTLWNIGIWACLSCILHSVVPQPGRLLQQPHLYCKLWSYSPTNIPWIYVIRDSPVRLVMISWYHSLCTLPCVLLLYSWHLTDDFVGLRSVSQSGPETIDLFAITNMNYCEKKCLFFFIYS